MASRRSINWSSVVRCGASSEASGRTPNTKTMVASASSTQATAISTLLIGVPASFLASPIKQFSRDCRPAGRCQGHATTPPAHDLPDQKQRDQRGDHRSDPYQRCKPFFWRIGKYRRAVFLNEGLQDQI